jgi:hypothetical protein
LAAKHGRVGIGVDLDPLAVQITRSSCHPAWAEKLEERAEAVLDRARRLSGKLPEWIARDPETRDFVEYWFAPEQAEDLSRLARVLIHAPRRDDPLRVAFSRMIVTKERGASLARDTSHSRPHKVTETNDYDVFAERGGHLVMVVADSQLRGVAISNAEICAATATRNSFRLVQRDERVLPAQHRYLPPPTASTGTLATRMKHEVIFTFQRQ